MKRKILTITSLVILFAAFSFVAVYWNNNRMSEEARYLSNVYEHVENNEMFNAEKDLDLLIAELESMDDMPFAGANNYFTTYNELKQIKEEIKFRNGYPEYYDEKFNYVLKNLALMEIEKCLEEMKEMDKREAVAALMEARQLLKDAVRYEKNDRSDLDLLIKEIRDCDQRNLNKNEIILCREHLLSQI